MECFEVAAIRCGERLLTAVVPFGAVRRGSLWHNDARGREGKNECERGAQQDDLVFHGLVLARLQAERKRQEDGRVARHDVGADYDDTAAQRAAAPRGNRVDAHREGATEDSGHGACVGKIAATSLR